AQGWSASPPGGAKAVYVYKSDGNPDEYWVAAIFESKDAYMRNANTPQQDANFRQMRELLEADPEWHDGEIVHSFQS
ncbi:MAG TPA: hypothetical protein VE219_06015, partial [Candidatus Sulfotelmatobacter sp.]|nr:hypothetical protein [Candidatus Sulfotelmatobacter sp.]